MNFSGSIELEPMTGFEPVTCCLRNTCALPSLNLSGSQMRADFEPADFEKSEHKSEHPNPIRRGNQ